MRNMKNKLLSSLKAKPDKIDPASRSIKALDSTVGMTVLAFFWVW